MRSSLSRRVWKLEARGVDATGLKPYTEGWFTFWEEKLDRLWAGDDIGNVRIPIEVTDRMIAAADAEEAEGDCQGNRGTAFP